MAELKNEEIRRLLNYLRSFVDDDALSVIEEDLRSEIAGEIIREPEFLAYFPANLLDIENWHLRIISYSAMRLVQRGIKLESVADIFRQFIEYCTLNDVIITVGAYSILGKVNKKSITLRIDVDEITDEIGKAHTVTVFFGYGNTENTIFLDLEQ